jgi:hypothetical protein
MSTSFSALREARMPLNQVVGDLLSRGLTLVSVYNMLERMAGETLNKSSPQRSLGSGS